MDTYLNIARKILIAQRQPLSAKKIMEIAYRQRLVPNHIYGKTQYKTLQARLSEDIRSRPLHSEFIRTEPGKFFLRTLIFDPSTPEIFKREFSARPRQYELGRFLCLFIISPKQKYQDIESIVNSNLVYRAFGSTDKNIGELPIISFVVLLRGDEILIHRPHNKFHDPIKANRSAGFIEYLRPDDIDIFHNDGLGLCRSVERILIGDLNGHELARSPNGISYELEFLEARSFSAEHAVGPNEFFVVVSAVYLNDEFDPYLRAPAMREMRWVKVRNARSNIDDLDEISKFAMQVVRNETDYFHF